MPLLPLGRALLGAACMTAWGDFNDAAPLVDDGATEIPASGNVELDRLPGAGQSMHAHAGPAVVDAVAIATFLDVVFGLSLIHI